jgi:hypothetical protein
VGVLDRAAPDEDAESFEERALSRVEQVEAPVDCSAQRSLPLGKVARAAGQRRQASIEPGEDRVRRKELDPRGGQLDREWQALEAGTDPGHRDRVLIVELELRSDGLGTLDEQRDRVVGGESRQARQRPRIGCPER